jgi:hypothetical protein
MGILQSTKYIITIANGVIKYDKSYTPGDNSGHFHSIHIEILFSEKIKDEIISKLAEELRQLTYGRSFHKGRNVDFIKSGIRFQFRYRGEVPISLIKHCAVGAAKICKQLNIPLLSMQDANLSTDLMNSLHQNETQRSDKLIAHKVIETNDDFGNENAIMDEYISNINNLFSNIEIPAKEASIKTYIETVRRHIKSNQTPDIQGRNENWVLKSWCIKRGQELDMNSDSEYLVLHVKGQLEVLDIIMGGEFSKSIPLILKQADLLKNKEIIWHTWNSPYTPKVWNHHRWFYMIESAKS